MQYQVHVKTEAGRDDAVTVDAGSAREAESRAWEQSDTIAAVVGAYAVDDALAGGEHHAARAGDLLGDAHDAGDEAGGEPGDGPGVATGARWGERASDYREPDVAAAEAGAGEAPTDTPDDYDGETPEPPNDWYEGYREGGPVDEAGEGERWAEYRAWAEAGAAVSCAAAAAAAAEAEAAGAAGAYAGDAGDAGAGSGAAAGDAGADVDTDGGA
jgi:hypothetical protein